MNRPVKQQLTSAGVKWERAAANGGIDPVSGFSLYEVKQFVLDLLSDPENIAYTDDIHAWMRRRQPEDC